MNYYFEKDLDIDFEDAVQRVTEELKKEGFGILTEIDVKETMKKKLDKDMRPYRILGACNPPYAYRAIEREPNIGLMLPCNVVVQEHNGKVKVSAIDPVASMTAVENDSIREIASEIGMKLRSVIDSL